MADRFSLIQKGGHKEPRLPRWGMAPVNGLGRPGEKGGPGEREGESEGVGKPISFSFSFQAVRNFGSRRPHQHRRLELQHKQGPP